MKKTMILCAMIAAVASLAAGSAVAADGRPNVVLIITDDQGYGDLSCHGNPVLKTPNLDRLYGESVRLTDYHVAPSCSPTRAALMTGHWPNRTGVWHTSNGRSLLRENEVTMGQVFLDAGYATGMFGKWHLGDNYPFRPEDRGYSEVMRHGGGGVGQMPDFWDNGTRSGEKIFTTREIVRRQWLPKSCDRTRLVPVVRSRSEPCCRLCLPDWRLNQSKKPKPGVGPKLV